MGESERLLSVIRTQTEIVKRGLDLAGVMAVVTEQAQILTHADGGVLDLAAGDDMVYRAATGIAQSHLGLRLRRQSSISGFCVALGIPLRCDDTETDSRVNREACRRIGLRSLIVVPLKHETTVVGVLKVLAKEPAAFDDSDLQVLGLMADLIAASMYHATHGESGALFYQATHDPLTGLANRALFLDRLHYCLLQAQREGKHFAIVNLDMDGLKGINDRLGHQAGDSAIREFGHRLQQVSRSSDTVARLGGDEFAILLSRVEGRAGVVPHLHRLTEQMALPFHCKEEAVSLHASVGYALYPEDGKTVDVLLERADQAMYSAKRARKQQLRA